MVQFYSITENEENEDTFVVQSVFNEDKNVDDWFAEMFKFMLACSWTPEVIEKAIVRWADYIEDDEMDLVSLIWA